jgi:adenine-specific DNA-methyltransferase
VRRWVAAAAAVDPIAVPGASAVEARQLAALGGVAAALVTPKDIEIWPESVRVWAAAAPVPPDALMSTIRAKLASGDDALGEAYNACICAEHRRKLGTVFTPDILVDHMVGMAKNLLGDTPPAYVIDPGAGVGAFSIAAARSWPTAHVVAVDTNPVTLGLLAARFAYERAGDHRLRDRRGTVQLLLEDFLDVLVPLMQEANGPVLVLGNPPFTRTQALERDYKTRAANLGGGLITSGHANLATLFQAATVTALRPDDASCMVLPGSVMFTRASRDLRQALWDAERDVEVQRWPAATRAFIGRNVQAAVIAIGPERSRARPPLRLARAVLANSEVEITERWSLPRNGVPPGNWFRQQTYDQGDGDFIPLTEIARVRRGVATGANRVFFVSDEIAGRLPESVLLPGVRSLRRFEEAILDSLAHRTFGPPDEDRWLLAIPADHPLDGALRRYVEEHADAARGHLARGRDLWWSITDLPRPDILVSPLSKDRFKIVLNAVGAVPSNNLFGISMNAGDGVALARWLASERGQDALRALSRRYHGGSHKLEPGDLRRLQVPRQILGGQTRPTD